MTMMSAATPVAVVIPVCLAIVVVAMGILRGVPGSLNGEQRP